MSLGSVERLGAAWVLWAAFGGCAAPSPPNPEAPLATSSATALEPGAAPGAGDSAEQPGAQEATESPWRASFEEEMACRRAHCYTGGAARCLDTCYKYNHPRDPETHDRCNASCRRDYALDTCDELCREDKRAFSTIAEVSPKGQPRSFPACSRAANACNAACDTEPKMACLLGCVRELQRCEAAAE